MAITMIPAPDDAGRRLDRLLRKALPDMPLSAIHRLLRTKRVLVDGAPAEAQLRVKAGAVITLPQAVAPVSKPSSEAGPPRFEAPLPILWEGAGILAVNKPAGLAVHGPASLEIQVRRYLAPTLPPSLAFTPGPLHRLDRPTSGIILFSTNLRGAQYGSALIRERRIRKQYLALVTGELRDPARWEDSL
ncbi:MAG: RluA family pseudouridine synthase, partial [Treponema sp.]|nr:RluA family pseudouridine synthase [Treponema sp.]